LNAIIGYAELIEEECVEQGQRGFVPDLKKIQAAAKHQLALINDILDLSKVEAGRMDLYLEDVAVDKLVQDVVTTAQPVIERNANRLELELGADLGQMHTDITKVRQVLLNLLSNASKFTHQGTITVGAERRSSPVGDQIVFRVADTGLGMTPEQV